MISLAAALAIVKQHTFPLESEMVGLETVCGRILAQDIFADMDLPPFDRSQMDGYALRASDTKNTPVRLKIVGESAAGKSWSGEVKPGEAVRIMTGGAVPAGASAVQKLEEAREGAGGEFVEIMEATNKGQNIVLRGAETEKGALIFSAGESVNAGMIASLAAFGYAKVLVGRRPKVSVLATGNEIVDADQIPGKDQIRNSNSPMLRVFAESCGAIVKSLPIAVDELENLKSVIKQAAAGSDVLILTGGVSVGKYDLTKLAFGELGARIYFDKIALRPGKPTVFGRLNDTLIFGLPGNPVSAAVTFYLFARTSLRQMQGASETELKTGCAVLNKNLKGVKERDSYLPVTISTDKQGQLVADPIKWGGSSDFISFAKADALVFVPQNTSLLAGEAALIVFLK